MKKPHVGVALAGMGLVIANGALVTDAASACGVIIKAHDNVSAETGAALAGATQTAPISGAQLDAYNKLPPAIKAQLGAPVRDKILSADELALEASSCSGTVMCPW